MKAITLLIATLSQLALATTWSAVVTYQEGGSNSFTANYAGTSDTILASTSAVNNDNFGDNVSLIVGRNEQRFSIIRFDLSSMAGSYDSITSVSLTLTRTAAATALDFSINIYSIVAANGGWNEMEATWINREKSSSTPWQNASSVNQTNFLGATGDLLQTISYTTSTTAITINVPIAMALEWINNPNGSGGLALMPLGSSGSNSNVATFGSSEFSTASSRPLLTVNYTPIPEPSALLLALGGFGIMAVAFRRKLASKRF